MSSLSSRVLKATSIFGGVQVVNILCALVRTKLIAIWIGAAGVGLFAIYNGALEMITALSQLGMRQSAVRDISQHRGTSRSALVVAVVRRWGWLLGIFGAGITVAIAPLLSRWTFGDSSHTWWFMLIAIAVLATSLCNSELAIMQGLEQLRRLARASMWGVLAGFAVSVPMYYFWRMDSVVPSIIAYAVATSAAAMWGKASDGTPPHPTSPTLRETWSVGQSFIVLGVFMVASDVITQLAAYIFTAWLNLNAGDAMVGYYRGGFTVVNRYVGMVFSSIAMEYYPRLSGAVQSPRRTGVMVSHEITLVLWMLLPLVMVFICAAPLIVRILYTRDFLVIVPFISLAMAGTVLRGVSWCQAFVILARGDGKTFLLTEAASDAVMLGLNILFYTRMGLTGLGVAYIIWYLLYAIMISIVYRRYGLALSPRVNLLLLAVMAVSVGQLTMSFTLPVWVTLLTAAVSCIISVMALIRLTKRKRVK